MRKIAFLIFSLCFLTLLNASAQPGTQTIRGAVTDEASKAPGGFATIKLLSGSVPVKTAVADSAGTFRLTAVPVGRYNIEVSLAGYHSELLKEIVVEAGKETWVNASLREKSGALENIVVRAGVNKSKPLNNMAVASARMFSVEEAKRYAGGFDDYARLASSFAGVASNVGNNGIVIRGNAPRMIQWKMEGVEIPNPNHFADLATFGGGGLTGLSSQLLANSDFFTGAFPAEYGNALAGVFDMNLRNGNNEKRENTVQLGLLGIDAAMEGPFRKGKQSSYLFNYRYSTLGLLSSLMPDDAGGTTYQDLSFKLHFPTKKSGTFSIWGLGLADKSGAEAEQDSTKWNYLQDMERQTVKQYMMAAGIGHRYFINTKSFVKTSLATTANGLDLVTDRMSKLASLLPQNLIKSKTTNIILSSYVNTKFNARHTNRTGFTATNMRYDLLLKEKGPETSLLQTIVSEKGNSMLLNAYSSSSYKLSYALQLNAGINVQWFALNKNYSIEPRLGIKYQMPNGHSLALAYGLHSRLERLNYYFTKASVSSNELHNKNLDFTRARHFVLSYDWNPGSNMHIRIEPYYQQLFKVPVIMDSSYSFINLENDWFLNDKLENTGKGRNIGVDITVEKYLTRGFYYLLSTSIFDSKYKGGDGVWRNTRFNRNYLFNVLGGKEWYLGNENRNVVGINIRVSYQGGDHYVPVNEAASIAQQEIVYDGDNAFRPKLDPVLFAHFTLSYKKNKKKSSHEWALKVINATSQKEFYGFRYNYINQRVDINREALIVPNLSYKIQF